MVRVRAWPRASPTRNSMHSTSPPRCKQTVAWPTSCQHLYSTLSTRIFMTALGVGFGSKADILPSSPGLGRRQTGVTLASSTARGSGATDAVRAVAAEIERAPEAPFIRSEARGLVLGARDRHDEVFAHHVLAGDQFLGLAALFVEDHGGELLQRLARLVQGAPVRIHSRQLLDETDVTVI